MSVATPTKPAAAAMAARAVVEPWLLLCRHAVGWAPEGADLLLDLRRWRAGCLSGWSELLEGTLRSPRFLALTNLNLKALNQYTGFIFPDWFS
jgi:hypothetical protein